MRLNMNKIIPTIADHPQVVIQPDIIEGLQTDVVKATDPELTDKIPEQYKGMKDPVIRLSKNMKLSMRHVDIVENKVDSKDEWKWVDGECVEPSYMHEADGEYKDPRNGAKYTTTQEKKFKNYGTIKVESVSVQGEKDKAKEISETIVVTNGTEETNDDKTMVEAIPVLAINAEQKRFVKLEGRHGEVDFDAIDNENYLTRPGMEVKTSETYLAQAEESESESESEAESESADESASATTRTLSSAPNTTKTTTTRRTNTKTTVAAETTKTTADTSKKDE